MMRLFDFIEGKSFIFTFIFEFLREVTTGLNVGGDLWCNRYLQPNAIPTESVVLRYSRVFS